MEPNDSNIGSRKKGWGKENEKTFTPQAFSYFPFNQSIDEIEIWISIYIINFNTSIIGRHRIDDL